MADTKKTHRLDNPHKTPVGYRQDMKPATPKPGKGAK